MRRFILVVCRHGSRLISIFGLDSIPDWPVWTSPLLQQPAHLTFQCPSSPTQLTSRQTAKWPAASSTKNPTSSSSIPTSRFGKLSKRSSWLKRTSVRRLKSSRRLERFSPQKGSTLLQGRSGTLSSTRSAATGSHSSPTSVGVAEGRSTSSSASLKGARHSWTSGCFQASTW